MKIFAYIVIIIVASAIVAGFFIVGSPQDERLRRFDETRIQDLQSIQSQIVSYWQSKGRLPVALSDLEDSISGIKIPADPQTNEPYTYTVKGPAVFDLCANFAKPDMSKTNSVQAGFYAANWTHGAGMTCFERTIDKDIYKLMKPLQMTAPLSPPAGQTVPR